MEPLLYVLLGGLLTLGGFFLKWSLFGFSAQKPSDYAHGAPILDLRKHLKGEILCDGVIFGPTGRVTSRFEAQFSVRWDGNVALLSERFQYDSGEVEQRDWQLTLGEDGRVEATASDVVGTGIGRLSGPALQLRYRIKLPERAGGHVLSACDWMYLTPSGTIVNRSQFRKYGIKVAELVATMRRKEDT